MEDCIFCKIILGDIPSRKIFENEHTIAIMDAFPSVKGHVLVITKEHAVNIFDATEKSIVEGFRVAHKIAPHVRDAMEADGINIHMNNGEAAFQAVMHPHIHILPRFKDDGRKPWGHIERSNDEIEGDAERMRENIAWILSKIAV